MMSRKFRLRVALATVVGPALTSVLIGSAAWADPLHKFAKQDAYWHHGSGWVFPRDIGPFKLQGSATQLDGNDDVSGEYVMEKDGVRTTAFVDVYYPTSAAPGANLDTARTAMVSSMGEKCAPSQSEQKFTVTKRPDIDGLKVVFQPQAAAGCARSELYFFRTPNWVIAVRATAAAPNAALDDFVQALRWDTLDTDPYEHDLSP